MNSKRRSVSGRVSYLAYKNLLRKSEYRAIAEIARGSNQP
jgi:hypothetical protein